MQSCRRIAFALGAGLTVCGCASVDVQHLDPTGHQADGAPGLRYYLPKPYILVTLLPAEATAAGAGPTVGGAPARARNVAPPGGAGAPPANSGGVAPPGPPVPTVPPGGGGGQQQSQQPQQQNQNTTGAASPSPTSDTSFQASTNQYVVKLIYLPDYQNPMSITLKAGLFGTASFNPVLQDGWMLTSLQGSADNSQLIQLANQLVTSLAGGAGTAAKTAATAGAKGAAAGGGPPPPTLPSGQVLSPGLYEVHYNSAGTVTLCAATRFGNPGDQFPASPPNCS